MALAMGQREGEANIHTAAVTRVIKCGVCEVFEHWPTHRIMLAKAQERAMEMMLLMKTTCDLSSQSFRGLW